MHILKYLHIKWIIICSSFLLGCVVFCFVFGLFAVWEHHINIKFIFSEFVQRNAHCLKQVAPEAHYKHSKLPENVVHFSVLLIFEIEIIAHAQMRPRYICICIHNNKWMNLHTRIKWCLWKDYNCTICHADCNRIITIITPEHRQRMSFGLLFSFSF